MTSFFFNIVEQKHMRSSMMHGSHGYLDRVDISNGIVFVEGVLSNKQGIVSLKNLDRMILIIMPKSTDVIIRDNISNTEETVRAGEMAMYVSSRQDMDIVTPASENLEVFMLFVADFFLKRYLSGDSSEPVDYLYRLLQRDTPLERISLLPVDATSLYTVTKLQEISHKGSMQSIRAEHRVIEFMIHRFGLLDIIGDEVREEELALASRAKRVLLDDFASPPTIDQLAHLCATNASKLKKVFKKVYRTTVHEYVEHLRMEEANLLLKDEQFTVGDVARRVGYRHQGYFSKRFFETYGIYPKYLRQ